jgi:hypothetical protein
MLAKQALPLEPHLPSPFVLNLFFTYSLVLLPELDLDYDLPISVSQVYGTIGMSYHTYAFLNTQILFHTYFFVVLWFELRLPAY